jgi:hypothetical protein
VRDAGALADADEPGAGGAALGQGLGGGAEDRPAGLLALVGPRGHPSESIDF